jgi:hypothetical protein
MPLCAGRAADTQVLLAAYQRVLDGASVGAATPGVNPQQLKDKAGRPQMLLVAGYSG